MSDRRHDLPTVALDPSEIARVERVALRQGILSLINDCARAMAMPKQPPQVLGRLTKLVAELTSTLEELAQVQ